MSVLTQAAPREVALSSSRDARFARLVDAQRDRAVRVAWRLTGEDLATAEEVAQDALLRAYSGLSRFRDDAALETWFYRILVRQAANRRRWRGLRLRWGALWGAPDDGSGGDPLQQAPEEGSADGDPALRARIAEAMELLSPGQRTVFTLVHLEGFTISEAAGMAGMAPGTAKSHLHRALAKLRAALAPQREELSS